MALTAPSSVIADISGKLGDQIYSRNRGGAYVKAYAFPTTSPSSRQLAAQSNFADAIAAWQALDDDTYLKWETLAKSLSKKNRIGVSRQISARSVFLQRYLTLAALGQSTAIGPYNDPFDTGIQSMSLSASASTVTSTIIPIVPSTTCIAGLHVSNYLPPGRRSPNSTSWRILSANQALQGLPTINITAAVTAAIGSPASFIGDRIILRAQVVQTFFPGKPSPHRSGRIIRSFSYASTIITP